MVPVKGVGIYGPGGRLGTLWSWINLWSGESWVHSHFQGLYDMWQCPVKIGLVQ